ncbi:MAG: anthranilate phosphoribosyltransferase [Chloroflexi bacterium]|nr:anthranilate phosphoribosyltransferase [Chloroflexota bacterium]
MIREAIEELVAGNSLSTEQAAEAMNEIMSGEATPAQFGAFVTALRLKGETPDEIAGMAQVMREKALRVNVDGPLVDTAGTGGDASGSFNISTTAALVVAGAGVKVAKHGNRAMSGACGSADVLEALGVKIDLSPEGVERCLEEIGFGFMFAQRYHPSMRFAAGPRREIGIRTVFNILGPLTNPAGATSHLVGVADAGVGEKMAQVLGRLGGAHALVVHGMDGLDEITLGDETQVWELKDGSVSTYTTSPEEMGFSRVPLENLKAGSVEDSVRMLRDVLRGKPGPTRDIVLMNAAAALLAADRVASLKDGVSMAAESIDSGEANRKLEALVKLTQKLE